MEWRPLRYGTTPILHRFHAIMRVAAWVVCRQIQSLEAVSLALVPSPWPRLSGGLGRVTLSS